MQKRKKTMDVHGFFNMDQGKEASDRLHILICGEKRAGKTTLIDRIIRETSLAVYGYKTQMVRDAGDSQISDGDGNGIGIGYEDTGDSHLYSGGFGHVYIVPAGGGVVRGTGRTNRSSETNRAGIPGMTNRIDKTGSAVRPRENEVGIAGGRVIRVNPEVFDRIGCALVRDVGKDGDGMIVMDEIGYMEEEAGAFCAAVREAFDGDIPVLASIKRTEHASRHIDTILHHPKANVFMLTESNREEIYVKVRKIVEKWEQNCARNSDLNCGRNSGRNSDLNSARNNGQNNGRNCDLSSVRNCTRKGGNGEV